MRADFELPFDAPQAIRDALKGLGRSEDVSFSPDNRRLALACLDHDSIAIVDVAITICANRPHVMVTNVAEYSSPCLMTPHGIEFLDDDTLLVANREGNVVAFRLPSNGARGDADLTPIDPLSGKEFKLLSAPGSVAIIRDSGAPVEVLICNNRGDTVTRHVLEVDPLRVMSSDILLYRGLDFPDSVAVTHDKRWIAISNHDAHVVMLYPRTAARSVASLPACILRGAMYPHGLQFSADGRHLFVADAGRPYVQLYERDGETWRGVQYPTASIRVMADEIFKLGRDAESRGPKGVAIDNDGHVLAVTFEKQPVAFFDICELLARTDGRPPEHALRVSYELEALERGRARIDATIRRFTGARIYRVTKPLLRYYATWSRTR